MSIVIENDLKASEQSVEQLNKLTMLEHPLAMCAYDMEDLVDSLTELGRKLKHCAERIGSSPCSSADKIKLEDEWAGYSKALQNVSTTALQVIRRFAKHGHPIRGKAELEKLNIELRASNIFSLESVRHSIQQANEGKLTPLSALRDALSN